MNVETLPRVARDVPPFRREPLPLPPGNTFLRSLTARAVGEVRGVDPAVVAAERWPSDRLVAQWLTRSATGPALTTQTGWAAELVRLMVMDGIAALGPASAAAQLLRACVLLSYDGNGIISAPGFVAAAGNAGFVAEGAPIPVRQLNAAPTLMSPHKLASIAVLTEEMIMSSNAETLIGDALIRSAGAALDAALFDTTAASAARPAGLRNGIAAITASVISSPWDAYFADAAALIDAIAPVAGNGPYYLIASPGRAISMRLRALGEEGDPFYTLGSNAVPTNQVIAVAPNAVVAAIAPDPEIESASAGTLHMDDAPQPVGSSAPGRSLFQTASVALKMRWRATWALRDPRGVAWLTPAW